MEEPPLPKLPKQAVWGLIALVAVVSIIFPPKTAPEGKRTSQGVLRASQLFLSAPNKPYYPEIYTSGTIIQIINCESNWRHYDENGKLLRGKHGEIGIAQFLPSTWEYFNKLRGTNLDITSREDQLDMIEFAEENNLLNHWTCYAKKSMPKMQGFQND